MMDTSIYPTGTPVERLPAFNISESEALPGGLAFVVGFNVVAVQALVPSSPRLLVWPCPVFAFTDGETAIAAVIQNLEFGIAEVVLIPNGLSVTRQMLRKTYQTCIELENGNIEYLWVHAPAGDERLRRRLRRLGFICASGHAIGDDATFCIRTSQMFSAAARRRLRMKLA